MPHRTAVVVGGSAGVGRALATSLARAGYDIVLAARDLRDLRAVAADIELRYGVTVVPLALDLLGADTDLEDWFTRCTSTLPDIEAVVIPAGTTDPADEGIVDWRNADALVTTNFLAVMKLANRFLSYFDGRGRGTLVLFSSIAAAAPRRRNVVYAASKSALESYARSMQHRFAETSVHVQVYALGYVDTTMARGQQLLLPLTSPDKVADVVVRGLGRPHRFGYVPRYWSAIVWVLRRLPWRIYRRLTF